MRFHARVVGFYKELRRRKVFRVASVYLVTAWGASLGAAELFPAFGLPEWSVRTFVLSAALGFPIAVALAWIYEVSDRGISWDSDGAGVSRTTQLARGVSPVVATWSDASEQHERAFREAFILGRDDECDLRFDDPMVSRRHARIYFSRGRWWIEDLDSRNGVRVDGELVDSVALPEHCIVQLHDAGAPVRLQLAGIAREVATLKRAAR